jgi:hypothetical protein
VEEAVKSSFQPPQPQQSQQPQKPQRQKAA